MYKSKHLVISPEVILRSRITDGEVQILHSRACTTRGGAKRNQNWRKLLELLVEKKCSEQKIVEHNKNRW